jgi:enamine deaminase RidA (YjgF/YER057c/UK114 family)
MHHQLIFAYYLDNPMSVYEKLKALEHHPGSTCNAGRRLRHVRANRQPGVHLGSHRQARRRQPWVGQLGKNIDTAEGKAAARAIAIDLIGTLQAAVGGDLTRVKRIVKVMSLVNSTPDYTEQHLVTNGCSELLGEVFGDAGKHARSAFGVAQIPLGACVEIELIAEVA